MEKRYDNDPLKPLIGLRIQEISFAGGNFTLIIEGENFITAFSQTRLVFKNDVSAGIIEDTCFTNESFVIKTTAFDVFVDINDDCLIEYFSAIVGKKSMIYRFDDK